MSVNINGIRLHRCGIARRIACSSRSLRSGISCLHLVHCSAKHVCREQEQLHERTSERFKTFDCLRLQESEGVDFARMKISIEELFPGLAAGTSAASFLSLENLEKVLRPGRGRIICGRIIIIRIGELFAPDPVAVKKRSGLP